MSGFNSLKKFESKGASNKHDFQNAQPAPLRNGLVYPIASAGLLGTWTVGRILYINGYGSGNPDKRMLGAAVSHLGDLPLIVMSFFAAHKASVKRASTRTSAFVTIIRECLILEYPVHILKPP